MNKDDRRGKLLIEPRFQAAFLLRLAGWITLATVIAALVAAGAALVVQSQLAGALFYVEPEAGAHPIWLSVWHIVLPALAVALPVNLALTLVFALYYSQRLAGPVHRLSQDMLKLARGEKLGLHFQLRESDELQEVAHAFDALLQSLAEKRP